LLFVHRDDNDNPVFSSLKGVLHRAIAGNAEH
jgi:hypothetical protein